MSRVDVSLRQDIRYDHSTRRRRSLSGAGVGSVFGYDLDSLILSSTTLILLSALRGIGLIRVPVGFRFTILMPLHLLTEPLQEIVSLLGCPRKVVGLMVPNIVESQADSPTDLSELREKILAFNGRCNVI